MITFPNAKINLGLQVLNRRPDGYHNLETVFYPVKINDLLEVVESEKLKFTSSGLAIPGNLDENLCVKAYELMRTDHNLPPVHIHLHKNIPIGAGLGGGSSDAAFLIKLLNEKFHLHLTDEKMVGYARQLGADCAFFIANKPALAKGIGDELIFVDVDLSEYFLVVVMPDDHVSTAEAYGNVVPKLASKTLSDILSLKTDRWKSDLSNDFEKSVFPHHPKISSVKSALYEAGALYAVMSGSGAAVLGIFSAEISFPNLEKNNRVFYGV